MALVRFYQLFISPVLGSSCRYYPTCSSYMMQALETWGPIKGLWIGLKRIGRCHPWAEGGVDPVPLRVRAVVAMRMTTTNTLKF